MIGRSQNVFFHRVNMTLRRWLLIGYYKFIFGKKVIFKRGFRSRGCFSLFVTDKAQIFLGGIIFDIKKIYIYVLWNVFFFTVHCFLLFIQ